MRDLAANDHPSRTSTRPNIIVILADDLGYGDVYDDSASAAGGDCSIVRDALPHIQALAQDGVALTDCYVTAPVCTPVRSSMLTGRYQLRTGLLSSLAADDPRGLSSWEVTLPELLRQVGYRTGLVGKWHLGVREHHLPTRHGFDFYYGPPYSNDIMPFYVRAGEGAAPGATVLRRNDDDATFAQVLEPLSAELTSQAIQFIDGAHAAGQPFFLFLPSLLPHVPIFSPRPWQTSAELYANALADLDDSVGALRAALQELGISNNTIVIFTSDNGPATDFDPGALPNVNPERWVGGSVGPFRPGEGKQTVYEGGVRVPFLISWPGDIGEPGFPTGKCSASPILFLDVYRTLATLADAAHLLPDDRFVDGLDVTTALRDPDNTYSAARNLFFFHPAGFLQAMRTQIGSNIWKMHFHDNQRLASVKALYDLSSDPAELNDVQAANPQIVAELVERANLFREDTSSLHPQTTIRKWATNRPQDAITASSFRPNREPWRAFDGQILGDAFADDSRWSSDFDPANPDDPIYDDQWIAVDLGVLRPINQIVLRWEAAYARRYTIEISTNGVSWSAICDENNGGGGTDVINTNVLARHVRLRARERVAVDLDPDDPEPPRKFGYSLYEFEANYLEPTPNPPLTNLALNRPLRASSARRDGSGAIHPPQQATDSNMQQIWRGEIPRAECDKNASTRWASQWSDNEWIYVDLGAPQLVREVVLHWEAAFARRYRLQVSADQGTWTNVYTEQQGNGGTDYIRELATNAAWRFLRVRGLERGTPYGYSLCELEVYNHVSPAPNLALGKPVAASSEGGPGGGSGHVAAHVVDGNRDTRWTSQYPNDPFNIDDPVANDQWIEIDLGAEHLVATVVLRWESAYGRTYQIQVRRTAGDPWTVAHYELDGNGGVDALRFFPLPARYVRMQGMRRGTHWGYSLWEFEVYGSSS